MSDTDDSPIGRAFRILETLAGHPEGLALSEIAASTDLVVATAHRQLSSLVGLGLVRKQNAKSFVLGERMWMMASLMTNGADITHAAMPILKELADHFGETAFIARLVGEDVEVMETCNPTAFGQSFAQPGRGMPLYAAATGKILLALKDDTFLDAYMKLPRTAFTANTKVKEEDIRADLADIRRRHIAICNNEFDPGILSYATAVYDHRTKITYALAVFGLAERFSLISAAKVETQLLNAARKLGLSLRGMAS